MAEKILKKRKYVANKSYHVYLKNPNPLLLMMKPTSPTEIENIITKSDIYKKTGLNILPQPLPKSIKKSIAVPLSNMFNMSFSQGQCTTVLKISSVIPIFKKDSEMIVQIIDQSPYFPISTGYLNNWCSIDFTHFLKQINVYIVYNLD